MAAAAFPAPTTKVLPRGGAGRCRGNTSDGDAEAIAASNILRNRSLGSIIGWFLPPLSFSTPL
jgi:hypothetical protein